MQPVLSKLASDPPGPVIVLVAGEVSGDLLGADLIKSLRKRYPRAHFVGIGGERMKEAGFRSIVPMERLSVMGLVEIVGRLRELFRIRARIRDYCIQNRPAVMIGIDAPDFTLGLERQVREAGIPSVHYVSPSVWAWRRGRIKGIAKSVDLMLTLLPFEARFYEEHGVPVRFVGHPMADQIPREPDRAGARDALELPAQGPVVAMLPGSRRSEVAHLGPVFLDTALWLKREGGLSPTYVIPCINRARWEQIEGFLAENGDYDELDIRLVDGRSREVMTAADAVLMFSGTATLEAALLKRPMVVANQINPVTFWIVSRMVYIEHVALPNLLAPEPILPEFLQEAANPEALGQALLKRLTSTDTIERECQEFEKIHDQLQRNASERAAEAIEALMEGQPLPVDREEEDRG